MTAAPRAPRPPTDAAVVNAEVEALRVIVRALDVELYGPATAANVHSDEYASKLFARGVRAARVLETVTDPEGTR